VAAQIGKLRPGVARWIDSSAEGLIDKDEFAPRIPRLRQRLARLEAQRQAGAAAAAVQTEWPLIIGRLEAVATTVHSGVETADWASQRALLRTLVKRVEVARDQVNIVFRVDPYAGDPDPEKKSLPLCRRSECPPLWRSCGGRRKMAILQDSCFQPGFELPANGGWCLRLGEQGIMVNAVKTFGDVNFEHVLGPKGNPVVSGDQK
jgi:hypothetical protein